MSGRDVELAEEKEKGYYILLNGDVVLGIGLAEGNKVINQTPKSRRTLQQYRTI
jgi:NOL1/NOP2/fmu family ribosome biogenesis protein